MDGWKRVFADTHTHTWQFLFRKVDALTYSIITNTYGLKYSQRRQKYFILSQITTTSFFLLLL